MPDARPHHVENLVSAELIDQTELIPQRRYCFRHPLVRTVAYELQLTASRFAAHKRLAVALAQRGPRAHNENAAMIANHLESAGDTPRPTAGTWRPLLGTIEPDLAMADARNRQWGRAIERLRPDRCLAPELPGDACQGRRRYRRIRRPDQRYLHLVERLDARGRLAEARRMVAEIT